MTAHPQVSFTQMADGTAEDHELLDALERDELRGFPERFLGFLLRPRRSHEVS